MLSDIRSMPHSQKIVVFLVVVMGLAIVFWGTKGIMGLISFWPEA